MLGLSVSENVRNKNMRKKMVRGVTLAHQGAFGHETRSYSGYVSSRTEKKVCDDVIRVSSTPTAKIKR